MVHSDSHSDSLLRFNFQAEAVPVRWGPATAYRCLPSRQIRVACMEVGSTRIRSASSSSEAKQAAAVQKNEPLHWFDTFLEHVGDGGSNQQLVGDIPTQLVKLLHPSEIEGERNKVEMWLSFTTWIFLWVCLSNLSVLVQYPFLCPALWIYLSIRYRASAGVIHYISDLFLSWLSVIYLTKR